MKRCAFLVVAIFHLMIAGAASAQEPAKQYHIGIISSGGNPRSATFYVAFEDRLRELGWVDGKNLAIHFESGDSPSQLSTIASRMVQRRVVQS